MQRCSNGKGLQRNSCWFDRIIFRVLVFILIGIGLFIIIGHIFMPKRFSYAQSSEDGKLRYYYNEEKDSIDVLILGTSHAYRGILPMEMYQLYGIKSYNLATSTQPIEVTYYVLREAIKYQSPKVIIWDVSNLYIDNASEARWKLVTDEMKIGVNKISLIREYLKKAENAEEIYTYLFPLPEYHTRWKELLKQDFELFDKNKHYFGKGGQVSSVMREATSVDEMNSFVNRMIRNNEKVVYEYHDGEENENREWDVLYSTEIPVANVEWFFKIKKMCDENNIQLLGVKVPAIEEPQRYSSAWTLAKYDRTKAFCEENGVAYYDLLYDTDVGLDWTKDTIDAGRHLNLYGAQKVSANLGNYLTGHYELPNEHNVQWDKDLKSYEKVRKVVLLELEQDFVTYVNMLEDEYKDNMIFITVSDEMTVGLNEADINALRNLGLQADYSKALQHSYIAVIENGAVQYEALSNRPLDYSGVCSQSGKEYELHSSGWWTVANASIKIDGVEYAVNTRGLNIVVYDNERDLVLDSVAFDTWAEVHPSIRNDSMTNRFKDAFERYIVEVEDK